MRTALAARARAVATAFEQRRWPVRALALAGVGSLLAAFVAVLRDIVVVTGDPTTLYLVVAGAVAAGTAAAWFLRPRTAAATAAVAFGVGTYLYFRTLPGGTTLAAAAAPAIADAVSLLSGLSVLRIVNADLWALSAAPSPVFLGWYLAVRRRYTAAAAVGGAALGIMVLTGDATVGVTLAGVVGGVTAAAVGDCERRGERVGEIDPVAVAVAAMVAATLFVGVVPGAVGAALSIEGLDDDPDTVETSLLRAGDSVPITGSIELSEERRYTVEAERAANWRVGTYDRYTGGGWVKSGDDRPYDGPLSAPPGRSRSLEQRYTAESTIGTLPAAARPTRIDGVPVPVRVSDDGTLRPASALQAGESYTVESRVPTASPAELRRAGTDYPEGIETRYTQLPSDTPERVTDRTDRLTANAENPYDTARVLEYWFRTEYDYSLDVERPNGDIADSFLFEMTAGYCTYFATTMTTMLRTQGIPARFVVGYTPGERDGDEFTVRGYNSHAWVEVYVPEHGWIEFDPTPPEPREAAERSMLEGGTGDNGSDATPTPTAANGSVNPELIEGANATETETAPDSEGGSGGEGAALPSVPLPSGERVGGGVLVALAAAWALGRSGILGRVRREIWLRRAPRGDPESVVEGAYRRAVYLEKRAGRRKAPGETPRQFFADADGRLRRIAERYERARYGGAVDAEAAAAAVGDLRAVRRDRSGLPSVLSFRRGHGS